MRRYLFMETEVFRDLTIQEMVAEIKEKEISDLYLLGAKARKRLHELLDEGDTKVIETTAVMDRSFQQRRLLENKSTQNIGVHSLVRKMDELSEEEREIREMLRGSDEEDKL